MPPTQPLGRLVSRALRVTVVCAAAALLAAPTSPAAAHAPRWRVTDLGVLKGGLTSEAVAVNDRGDVVGSGDTGPVISPVHAILWRGGRTIDLGTLGGTQSAATDVNNAGQVVGWSYVRGDTVMHAFLWSRGRMTDLGTLGGPGSYATAINDRGEVVGFSRIPGPNFVVHAFRWSHGRLTDLGTLNGGYSEAVAVNNAGTVVGHSSTDGMNAVPVRFLAGHVTPLPIAYGQESAVDNAGRILFNRGDRVFLWTPKHVTTLRLTAGTGSITRVGLNDHGQVVGTRNGNAFLWTNGRTTLLQGFQGHNASAMAINNHQLVVGASSLTATGGAGHAMSWTLR